MFLISCGVKTVVFSTSKRSRVDGLLIAVSQRPETGKHTANHAQRAGPNSRLDSSLSALVNFWEIALKLTAASMFSTVVAPVEVVIHLRRFSS